MVFKTQKYGNMPDGTEIQRFILENENGVSVAIINYGAILETMMTPDRNGQSADIVLGFDNLKDWTERNATYFGAVIGRCGNRIGQGRFSIDGKEYQLAINNGPNCLHGGLVGFDKKVWSAEDASSQDGPAVRLTLHSPDGDENFPGNLDCAVTYTLRGDNGLKIDYEATSDKPTIVNLTNHSYFNLGGHKSGHIGKHNIRVNSSRYTPNDENTLPTGEIASLDGTGFDFREETNLGDCLSRIDGLDHNYILDDIDDFEEPVAVLSHPESGRSLEMFTTELGMQIYSAEYLDGIIGKGKAVYNKQNAICLEAQNWPDAVNHDDFPNAILRPGEQYRQTTIYKVNII